MAGHDSPNGTQVASLAEKLYNPEFVPICRAVETVTDAHARKLGGRIRSVIVDQTDDMFCVVFENYLRIDSAMLLAMRAAVPDANYHFIEVMRTWRDTPTPYAPVAVSLRVGRGPPAAQPPSDEEPAPAAQVSTPNLRDIGVPEKLRPTVQKLLGVLVNGNGHASLPVKNVRFAPKQCVVLVADPPTYSYDFLMSLFNKFPGVLEEFRYEAVMTDGEPKTHLALHLQDFDRNGSGGYVRGGARRSLLSRLNPFS